MRYMIILHNVPHELTMYIEELKQYGEVVAIGHKFPNYVWIESPWDKEILKELMGVKSVYLRRQKYGVT